MTIKQQVKLWYWRIWGVNMEEIARIKTLSIDSSLCELHRVYTYCGYDILGDDAFGNLEEMKKLETEYKKLYAERKFLESISDIHPYPYDEPQCSFEVLKELRSSKLVEENGNDHIRDDTKMVESNREAYKKGAMDAIEAIRLADERDGADWASDYDDESAVQRTINEAQGYSYAVDEQSNKAEQFLESLKNNSVSEIPTDSSD